MGLFDKLTKGAKAAGAATAIKTPGLIHPDMKPIGKVFTPNQMADEYAKALLNARADDLFSDVGVVSFNDPLLNKLPDAVKLRLQDLLKKREGSLTAAKRVGQRTPAMRQMMEELQALEAMGDPADMRRIVELREKLEAGKRANLRSPQDQDVRMIDEEIRRTLLKYFTENPDKVVQNNEVDGAIPLARMRVQEDEDYA